MTTHSQYITEPEIPHQQYKTYDTLAHAVTAITTMVSMLATGVSYEITSVLINTKNHGVKRGLMVTLNDKHCTYFMYHTL